MLIAPTIDVRSRIPEEIIREMVSRISTRFKPLRIILFGSYAKGEPRAESDVDLLVIMNISTRESTQALEIRQAIQPMFAVDILVITPSRLNERLQWGDSFLKEIIDHGIVMYESPDK